MHLSVSLTSAPELANLFIPSFARDILWLQILYSISPNKVSSSTEFLLLTFPYTPLLSYPKSTWNKMFPNSPGWSQIFSPSYSSPSLLLKIRRASFQPSCGGRRSSREQRSFLFAEVPRRIMLCLNRPSCHHKKDAYGWLLLFYAALA